MRASEDSEAPLTSVAAPQRELQSDKGPGWEGVGEFSEG